MTKRRSYLPAPRCCYKGCNAQAKAPSLVLCAACQRELGKKFKDIEKMFADKALTKR